MESNSSNTMAQLKLKVDFPKEAGNSKYMEELKTIENETGISIKIIVQMKGSPEQLEKAHNRISQIDMVNLMADMDMAEIPTTILNIQNTANETIKNDLNLIKKEIQELKDDNRNNTDQMKNKISEEIQKLLLNMGHAFKLDIQNNGTTLKEAFTQMEKNVNLSHKLMSEMIFKQLQFKIRDLQRKYEDLVTEDELIVLNAFIKSPEYSNYLSTINHFKPKAIHIASHLGRIDIVQTLLKKGESVNILCTNGSTPLHFASQSGHLNVVAFLINRNALIDLKNTSHGYTALHFAADHGQIDVVEHLCSKKANIYIRDINNKTALDIAHQKNYTEIIKIIENYNSKT